MSIQNSFFPIIQDIERQYIDLRKLGKSRDNAMAIIQDNYSQELRDTDDRLPVLIGLSLALCKKKELVSSIAAETLSELDPVIRTEIHENEYLSKIEQMLKDKDMYGNEAVYKKTSPYVPDWKIGDTFSHILSCPNAEKLGINGWLALFYKVGEYIDDLGTHRQLMCISLCPPEKIPTRKEELQALGFLPVQRWGAKAEYICQVTLKSKKAEQAFGLTKIGNFSDVSIPDNYIAVNPITAIPLLGKAKHNDSFPGYETQICLMYKGNGMHINK